MSNRNPGFIIVQTPFRISFFGGGTDLPEYFLEHGGQVLGTTINKYIYITLNSLPRFYEPRIRLSYSRLECVNSPKELQHDLCRIILEEHSLFGDDAFVDIHTFADLPASSGIGSSSTFTVGLLHAMYLLHGQYHSPDKIAKEAICIEREKLKEPGGWQDQYFAAYGGFNRIAFNKSGTTTVEPLAISHEKLNFLQQSCYMIFTSATRSSAQVQQHFSELSKEKINMLHKTKFFVDQAVDILYTSTSPEEMLFEFGTLLHEAWKVKRSISESISTALIDQIYETAFRAGAYGGKICGAGGGGFILMICPQKNIEKMKAALPNYHISNVVFDPIGTRSLYNKF